jgi:hypothetical protein
VKQHPEDADKPHDACQATEAAASVTRNRTFIRVRHLLTPPFAVINQYILLVRLSSHLMNALSGP